MILDLARNPRREIFAGFSGWALAEQHEANPDFTETIMAQYTRADRFQPKPAGLSPGGLFEAIDGLGGASGEVGPARHPRRAGGDLVAFRGARPVRDGADVRL